MEIEREMPSSALVELLRLFDDAGIEVWLDGGWGVDALLERQTRPHKDVDIILRLSHVPKLREILGIEVSKCARASRPTLRPDLSLWQR